MATNELGTHASKAPEAVLVLTVVLVKAVVSESSMTCISVEIEFGKLFLARITHRKMSANLDENDIVAVHNPKLRELAR